MSAKLPCNGRGTRRILFPLFLQTAVANMNRQASGSRIGNALSYTSKRRRTARKAQTIMLLFICVYSPSPFQSRP
ncbi:MAG: hypothetical protein ABSH08_02365 [Tepidisphaeraceae bacterium]